MPTCVFCDRPILSGEATSGRPPMAAHAACADAALADDRHWDAIAERGSAPGDEEPAIDGGDAARREAGCLGSIIAVAVAVVVLVAGAALAALA